MSNTPMGGATRIGQTTILYGVAALAFTAFSIYFPILPLMMLRLTGSLAQAGWLRTVTVIASVVVTLACGLFLRNRPASGVVRIGMVIFVLSALALTRVQQSGLIILILLIIESAKAVVNISFQSIIGVNAVKGDLGRSFASLNTSAGIGQGLGPLIGGFIADNFGESAVWMTGGILLIASGSLFLAVHRSPVKTAPPERLSFQRILTDAISKRSLVAIGCSSLVVWSLAGRGFILPLFLDNNGFAISSIGLILSVRGLSTIAARSLFSTFQRLLPSRNIRIGIALALFAIGLAAMSLSLSLWFQILTSILIGISFGISLPITMEIVATEAKRSTASVALSIRLLGNQFSIAMSPLIHGWIGEHTGLPVMSIISGALLVLIGTIIVTKPDRAIASD